MAEQNINKHHEEVQNQQTKTHHNQRKQLTCSENGKPIVANLVIMKLTRNVAYFVAHYTDDM